MCSSDLVSGKSMGHQAIAESGKKVRVMSKEDGQTVMRADYTLGPVGADEDGARIGRVSGMVFAPGADGALSPASEWVVLANDFVPEGAHPHRELTQYRLDPAEVREVGLAEHQNFHARSRTTQCSWPMSS